MKFIKIPLLVALLLMVQLRAEGRVVEGSVSSERDQLVNSGWNDVKQKVQGWWSNFRRPASESPATVENSAPVEKAATLNEQPAQPPFERQALVEDWVPTKVAQPKTLPAKVQTGDPEQAAKMKSIANSVSQAQLTKQVKMPKAPAAGIPLSKSGVPTFSLFSTKKEKTKAGFKEVKISVSEIPVLDVGQEESLIHQDFTLDPVELAKLNAKFTLETLKTPQALSDKDLRKMLGGPLAVVGMPEKVKLSTLQEDEKVTSDKVDKIDYKVAVETSVTEVPTRPLTPEEMKFLRALILYEQKDKCHIAAGLFYDLTESKVYQSSANFYLGICLHKMGLFSESVDRLIRSIEAGEVEYAIRSVEALASDLPDEFDVKVGKVLEGVVDKLSLDKETKIKSAYVMAKGALKRDNYALAHQYADRVPADHHLYRHAQYVMAVAEYGTGQGSVSLSRLEKLRGLLEKKPDPDLISLVALNLGRVAFLEKKYKESSKYFQDISKGHPLWIQALTEQAWSQLLGNDNEGAIGNMHSIQSPFFNSVYKPETFVVRTIGYLNLCQYPDAYRSLSRLEHEYKPWYNKMQTFLKNTKAPKDYYLTMAKYLSSPSQTEMGGMPFQVLREMGRHRDYLNIQESINHRIDESDQYGFLKNVIKKDLEKAKWLKGQAKSRLAGIETKLKLAKKDEKIFNDLNQLKQDKVNEQNLIEYYDFQVAVFEEGKTSLTKFEDKAKARLSKLRDELVTKAGDVLKKRLGRMLKDLESMFDNNEFLRYEVFAGSGENIRHDLAGGEKRVPASAKPTSKDLSWDFDGEFWEDEIGHYKSSLKDNCPKNQAAR
jgi:hypothetical protein